MLNLLSMSEVGLRPCMAAVDCSTHSQQRCRGLQQELTICILHAGNLGVWLGTFLYNMSCITPAILATLSAPPPPRTLAAVLWWAVTVPNIMAGCLFVSGSYCTWAAAGRTGSLLQLVQRRAPSGGFWACLLYFMVRALQCQRMQSCIQRTEAATGRAESLWHVQGSVGFLTGSILSQPLFVLAPSVLIDEWFGMFVGYVLGSLCFLSGSFISLSC